MDSKLVNLKPILYYQYEKDIFEQNHQSITMEIENLCKLHSPDHKYLEKLIRIQATLQECLEHFKHFKNPNPIQTNKSEDAENQTQFQQQEINKLKLEISEKLNQQKIDQSQISQQLQQQNQIDQFLRSQQEEQKRIVQNQQQQFIEIETKVSQIKKPLQEQIQLFSDQVSKSVKTVDFQKLELKFSSELQEQKQFSTKQFLQLDGKLKQIQKDFERQNEQIQNEIVNLKVLQPQKNTETSVSTNKFETEINQIYTQLQLNSTEVQQLKQKLDVSQKDILQQQEYNLQQNLKQIRLEIQNQNQAKDSVQQKIIAYEYQINQYSNSFQNLAAKLENDLNEKLKKSRTENQAYVDQRIQQLTEELQNYLTDQQETIQQQIQDFVQPKEAGLEKKIKELEVTMQKSLQPLQSLSERIHNLEGLPQEFRNLKKDVFNLSQVSNTNKSKPSSVDTESQKEVQDLKKFHSQLVEQILNIQTQLSTKAILKLIEPKLDPIIKDFNILAQNQQAFEKNMQIQYQEFSTLSAWKAESQKEVQDLTKFHSQLVEQISNIQTQLSTKAILKLIEPKLDPIINDFNILAQNQQAFEENMQIQYQEFSTLSAWKTEIQKEVSQIANDRPRQPTASVSQEDLKRIKDDQAKELQSQKKTNEYLMQQLSSVLELTKNIPNLENQVQQKIEKFLSKNQNNSTLQQELIKLQQNTDQYHQESSDQRVDLENKIQMLTQSQDALNGEIYNIRQEIQRINSDSRKKTSAPMSQKELNNVEKKVEDQAKELLSQRSQISHQNQQLSDQQKQLKLVISEKSQVQSSMEDKLVSLNKKLETQVSHFESRTQEFLELKSQFEKFYRENSQILKQCQMLLNKSNQAELTPEISRKIEETIEKHFMAIQSEPKDQPIRNQDTSSQQIPKISSQISTNVGKSDNFLFNPFQAQEKIPNIYLNKIPLPSSQEENYRQKSQVSSHYDGGSQVAQNSSYSINPGSKYRQAERNQNMIKIGDTRNISQNNPSDRQRYQEPSYANGQYERFLVQKGQKK